MKIVKCLPEFEYFYCILEKYKLFSKIRISKVTDYAAFIKLTKVHRLAKNIEPLV